MLLTIARGVRDIVLIFVTPILVAALIGVLVGSQEVTPWSVAVVVGGWVILTWLLVLRPAWKNPTHR